jgi:bifunctional non-homologous end joining protein LigD
MNAGQLALDGVDVSLSNTGKQLFADEGITKGDLIGYFRDMAPRILPYLRDRPLVMGRYPDGVTGDGIIQKNVPRYFPSWVSRVEVKKRDGSIRQVVCDKPATLVYLANQACLELHVFLSRVDSPDRPEQVVFDLDPPDEDHFDVARRCALDLRHLLEDELGLVTYVKTTGGKGLHVHVPLRSDDEFGPVRDFARDVAGLMVASAPQELTIEQRVQNRGRRLSSTSCAMPTPRW